MARAWHSRPLPFLLGLIAFLLVTPEAISEERVPIMGLVAMGLFVLGTLAVASHPRLRAASLGLLLLTFVARVAFLFTPSPSRYVLVQVTGCGFLVLTAVALMQVTWGRAHAAQERIEAAVATYLLLGFVWAQAYSIVHIADPDAFRSPDTDAAGAPAALVRASEHRFLYFSFVTLTTLGYGDVIPVRPLARSLAALEAVTGQLFLAITLARLVALRVTEDAG
jgi:voltage-gated potassium channel Kch